MREMHIHDLVIRNGNIVDGSGKKPFLGDIAIDEGKITKVGEVINSGKKEIDADGNLVSPGWVDIHTHYDGQVCWDPYLTPSSWHGVTTVVMGNCGVGFAPVKPGDQNFLIQLMEGVEDIPGTALHEGIDWEWETFPEFLDAIEKKEFVMDLGFMIGHGPVRSYVMGYDRCQNQVDASKDEINQMSDIVEKAINAGALGFSTSRTILHRDVHGVYVPGTEASSEEMKELAFAVDRAGEGTLEIVSDWLDQEIEMSWMKEYVEKSDCGLTVLQTNGDSVKTILYCEEQFLKGKNVRPQFPGRNVGLMFGLESSLHPFIGHPSYKEISHLPLNERLSIMRDPAFKQKILNESPSFREDLQKAAKEQKSNKTKEEIKAEAEIGKKLISNYETQFILSDPPNYEPTREDSIAYLAEQRNQSEEEVIYDELIKDNGKSLIYACFTSYENHKLEFVETFYKLKSSVAGGSDGGAHCGLICDASMPTTNLSHWARDRSAGNKIPLELIIRKQTKDTAETYGLFDRGEIKTGMIADINIIDFEKLNVSLPKMIFDLPKGGKRLVQESFGYLATIKSGEVVYENGQATGTLPGQVIRGKQTSEAKDTKEKISFYDRTVRLFIIKFLRLIWAARNKPVKSTVIS